MVRNKIRQYRENYINQPDPITFIPLTVDTTGRIYDDFSRFLFLHAPRDPSSLTNERPEEADQFCFLRAVCLLR